MGSATSHLRGAGGQLIKASKAGDADAVMELVSHHPQLLHYSTFRDGAGPCHYAARANHVEVLQQLVAKADELDHLSWQQATEHGGSADGCSDGAWFWHHRQQHQGYNTAPSLVKQLVNASTDRGITPLMLAVTGGWVESVKLLLDKGADPWAVDKLGGRTALHYTARTDNVEIVQLLVDAAGSNGPVNFPNRPNTKYVDVRTQAGFTAMHFAVHASCQQALAALLNNGANPLLSSLFDCLDGINSCKGTTALHLAARFGNEPVVLQLLKAYMENWYHRNLPDPRLLMDGDNQLPCQVAARRNHRDMALMLLPSTPLSSLFADMELHVLGPPTLSSIAGAVLHATLAGDLGALLQQQQRPAGGAVQDCDGDGPEQKQKQGCLLKDGAVLSDAPPTAAAAVTDAVPAAPAAACLAKTSVNASGADSTASLDSSAVCGVCFDAPPQVALAPCGHELCLECCKHMLDLNSRCVMTCPFCRAGVAHLQPLLGGCAAAATAAAASQCHQHQVLVQPGVAAEIVALVQ